MAEAYKCDRCKSFFDGKPAATVAVRPRDEMGDTRFYKSVCLGCAAATKDFVEDKGFDANVTTLKCLKNVGVDIECGACMQVAFTGTGANAGPHTCKQACSHRNPCPWCLENRGVSRVVEEQSAGPAPDRPEGGAG